MVVCRVTASLSCGPLLFWEISWVLGFRLSTLRLFDIRSNNIVTTFDDFKFSSKYFDFHPINTNFVAGIVSICFFHEVVTSLSCWLLVAVRLSCSEVSRFERFSKDTARPLSWFECQTKKSAKHLVEKTRFSALLNY